MTIKTSTESKAARLPSTRLVTKVTAASTTVGQSVSVKGSKVTISGTAARVNYIQAPTVSITFGTNKVSVSPSGGDTAQDTAKALRKALPKGYNLTTGENKDGSVTVTVRRSTNSEWAAQSDLDGVGADNQITKTEIKKLFTQLAKDGFNQGEKEALKNRLTSWLDSVNGGKTWEKGAREQYYKLAEIYDVGEPRVNRGVSAPPKSQE